MKAVVAAFNQEKALVGAFSVITNLRMELFEALMAEVEVAARSSAEVGRDYILLSSNGKAVESQGHMLGLYVQTGSHSGKPFYKQLHTVNTSFERLCQAEM